MAYSITYKSSVQKDLKNISKPEANKILNQIERILTLRANDFLQLKGEFKGLRKFRVGNYRIIYSLQGNDVIILKIGDRKDVYK